MPSRMKQGIVLSILEKIHSSSDVKKLSSNELEPLCAEIRDFLISSVSQTGGHLASNLGTVELTVAIHRVYDTSRDRLIFDVGHQCYTHKLLTGRRERFGSLRQYGGLSGFPKPFESVDDAFIAGHASNSVSVAFGMARARSLLHEDYSVVAVIGDGALTGGLSYEGLATAAAGGEPMVIILNDNKMSINPNVGGMARLLHTMRTRPSYIDFKRWYRAAFPQQSSVYHISHSIKEWVKARILPDNIFSDMGLEYIGPIDGHNVAQLETVLRWARELKQPVLVHVLTEKGKGFSFAEDCPERYHGVGRFDPVTGELFDGAPGFSEEFGKTLCELAGHDERIVAITAAMTGGVGLEQFAQRFPERFLDVGIAEGNAAAMAAGMAKAGLLPVFAVYSSFLQRSFDMLIHDVALQRLHVVFCVDRAGLVGSDGETHHGIFDVGYLSEVPGMTILCPANFAELRSMLRQALYEIDGPVAVRYPRGGEGRFLEETDGEIACLRPGSALTLIGCGTLIDEVLSAAELLAQRGISAEVLKLNRIRGDAFPLAMQSLQKTRRVLIAEEVCAAGCVGRRILARAAQCGVTLAAAKIVNLGEGIVPHGAREQLLRDNGLDARALADSAEELVRQA